MPALTLISRLINSPVLTQKTAEPWEDYFRQQTNSSLKQTTQLYLEAKAAGTTLPDDIKSNIDNNINSLKEYCKTSGVTFEDYVSQNLGEGVDENVLRLTLERSYLASYYGSEKTKSFTYTDDEVQKYYNEHKSDFDLVDYRSYVFDAAPATDANGTPSADTAANDAKLADARIKANAMLAAITDEASVNKLALQNAAADQKETYQNPDATLTKGGTSAQLSDEMKTWLYDDARKNRR